jgi:argininosuccinate lyase
MLDGVKTTADSIQIATGVLSTLSIFPEKMKAALTPDMLATDLADYLVRKGVPFRETHHISGRVVALAEKEAVPMDTLSLEQLKGVDARFGDDVMEAFNFESSVEKRTVLGGTSKKSVEEQIARIQELLE